MGHNIKTDTATLDLFQQVRDLKQEDLPILRRTRPLHQLQAQRRQERLLLMAGGRCKLRDCGTCWMCQEDARWERIFQEKFADPTYYTPGVSHVRKGSSLHDVMG